MPLKPLLFLFLLLFAATSVVASPLRDHYSPYLAMHADDAVQWQSWNEEVLARAKEENKLVFISSGYFACHWCHVMQRESFQHQLIANLLNQHFISVKIDRELSPDLDAHLFEFVEETRGTAGWPLNAFLTPQGNPLIGSGYLPAEEFLAMIKRLQVRWENDGEGLRRLAGEAAKSLSRPIPIKPVYSRDALLGSMRQTLLQALFTKADLLAGGLGDGAKFPRVPLLLSLISLPREDELDEFIRLTLQQMADHGLRDHVGGGFFRYTVDPAWQQPHFEKMLYDNALLASLYLQAAEKLGDESLRAIGIDTLNAMLRDFSHPGGGFVSALSALNDKGVEGGYYLFQDYEIKRLLPIAELRLFAKSWQLHDAQEWQGRLPVIVMHNNVLAESLRLSQDQAAAWQKKIRNIFLLERTENRHLPRDEKRLAGWNGLVLSALAQGAALKQGERFGHAATSLYRYLLSFWDGENLWRLLDGEGKGLVEASVDDYAYVAQGLFDWSEHSGDQQARKLAARLVGQAFYRFFKPEGWQASGDSAMLIDRRSLLADSALPSAAVVLANLGWRFGAGSPITERQRLDILFADPDTLLHSPLDYPGYISEIHRLQKRGSRLTLESPNPQ